MARRKIKFAPHKMNIAVNGGVKFHLGTHTDEFEVNVWFQCDCEVKVYAVTEDEEMFPLQLCPALDQTYVFTPQVVSLQLVPKNAKSVLGYQVRVFVPRYREVVDPIPYEVSVPLDENSMQVRMQRMFDDMCHARGLQTDYRGRSYNQPGYDDDDETEFGRGFTYDPEEERSIVEAAANRVRASYSDRLSSRMRSPQPVSERDPGELDDKSKKPGSSKPKAAAKQRASVAKYFDARDGEPLPADQLSD